MASRRSLPMFVVFAVGLLCGFGLIAPAAPVQAADPIIVDSFETPLRSGLDGTIAIGFNTFQDPNSSVAITTAAPPAPVPGVSDPNNVLKLDLNVVSFAGVTHGFENAAANQWVSQDWSAYEGISFWLYGTNSQINLFVDVLDNRNTPLKTTDDAERWSVAFKDNFSGWQEIKLPFANMARKEIGNGAPNDGFGLTEVHGWAFGTLGTAGPKSYYIDNVMLYGTAPIRPLTVGFSAINFPVNEGATATVTAKLSKPASEVVTVKYATKPSPARAGRDY
ncbi:MAG: hypothetical protein M3R61_08090, partial [Chloroflexota bacterium]|nr:hypothetical protein [Chloroflexota bacterium]